MAEIVLFHHAQGLTSGVVAFADALRVEGHTVHTPDLFDSQTYETLDEGVAQIMTVGFPELIARGARAVETLPADLVYVGFSLGVLPAQMLTQTRPGARGALFFHSCLPVEEFGAWPAGVPVQIHAMDRDSYFVDEGDIDAARALVAAVADAKLFLYPGGGHLFADRSLDDYDADTTARLTERVIAFLAALDANPDDS